MKIILLRHCESTSNAKDSADSQIDAELTQEGLDCAIGLALSLGEMSVKTAFVSPLKRTLQTIQPFLDLHPSINVIEDAALLERNLGDFTGTKIGAFQTYCDENDLDKVETAPPNGESLMQVYERTQKFIEESIKTVESPMLICGHKNSLLCLEIALTGRSMDKYYDYSSLKVGEYRVLEV